MIPLLLNSHSPSLINYDRQHSVDRLILKCNRDWNKMRVSNFAASASFLSKIVLLALIVGCVALLPSTMADLDKLFAKHVPNDPNSNHRQTYAESPVG